MNILWEMLPKALKVTIGKNKFETPYAAPVSPGPGKASASPQVIDDVRMK